MARLIAVLVLLLMLAPVTMAEPSRYARADQDWIGGLWHQLMAWVSGVGAHIIPSGSSVGGDRAGVSGCIIPNG